MNTTELLNMLCKALEIEEGSITLDDTVDTIEEWDSLGHLSILAALDLLSIDTDKDEFRNFDTVAKLVELVRKEGIIKD